MISISPNPIVVPFNGSADVLASAPNDQTVVGAFEIGNVSYPVTVVLDVPDPDWDSAVWTGLPAGVTAVSNGGGSYTLTHTS